MTSDPSATARAEIAHVLFMDIVGYSRLSRLEDQTRILEQLQALVRETPEFRRAEPGGELIPLPTGDGMALVFFRHPEAPVRCAMEVARAVRSLPELQLRMGVHSGPVYRVEDIRANKNVAGSGINVAQRVMECGDGGHILLSSAIAEVLFQLGDWATSLHDLGVWEAKHNERVHLYSLYTDDLGNAQLPARLRTLTTQPADRTALTLTSPSAVPARAAQVALLYKRNAQPDEELLQLLETHLKEAGFQVFIDRHLAIGVEWAREIERQIRASEAIVPLLSAAAVESEMLAYEVEIAHRAAQQRGRPRILPIRVDYQDPLPDALAVFLDPLEYRLWKGPEDNDRVLADLVEALRKPPDRPPVASPARLEPIGGAVPLDSEFYVVRPTDEEFRAAIARQDSIVLVKGARQMGKTSLLARGLQQARESGARVVLTDFQKLNAQQLETAGAFFLTLADWTADRLDLDMDPGAVWNERRGPSVNFERFMRREVLENLEAPLVWGLDEADRLFTCSFGSEVFGLFRSWHNERALDPAGPWSRLTLAIAYATEAHLFISDMNQSPFNVGTRLSLDDFTFEQVADLNQRYGAPLRDETEVARFCRLLSGHPYLVRRGLHELASRGIGLAELEAQADRDEGIYGDHLRRILVLLAQDAELLEMVRGVLRGRPCPTPEGFYRLRSAGVMAGDSAREVRPRCQLYATYLERHLL
jgi:class 3 adenylate cyclase